MPRARVAKGTDEPRFIDQQIQTRRVMNFNFLEIKRLTQIHGCLRASEAVIRLAGFTDNIWLIRFLPSGVTVSHSGDGYYIYTGEQNKQRKLRRICGKTHVVGTSFDLSVQPVLVLVPERRVAHQQDVQNHTCDTTTKLCQTNPMKNKNIH